MSWRIAGLCVAVLGCGRVDFAELSLGAYRKPIAIDRAKVVGGPHVGFPILVELAADADLAAHARPDGFDLGFVAADGGALPYERESFDAATGALVAWVRLPVLDASADTTLYLTFGAPDAADQQTPAAVWDASYQAVWHLTATPLDSTAHHNDGHPFNGLAFGSGQIGGALAYDGVDDYFDVPASASLDAAAAAGTFSVWIRWTQPARGNYQMVMSSSNRFVAPRDGFEWANQAGGQHYFYPWGGSETAFDYVSVPPFTANTWQYLAVTFEFATHSLLLYLDATPLATTHDGETGWAQIAQPADWLWGGNPAMGGSDYFLGAMDEIRVASVVRSSAWLETELRNQRSPSTFYTVGPVE
jgi:biopolymer transport protein ExbB